MENQIQSHQQLNQQPNQNKFIGKKIENTLSFNISSQIQSSQSAQNDQKQNPFQNNFSKLGQAVPLSYALPQKKIPSKLQQTNAAQLAQGQSEKSKSKQKTALMNGNGVIQQNSQQNLKNLIQQQQKSRNESQDQQNECQFQNQNYLSLKERRQQKKLEQIQQETAIVKKDISMIQPVTNVSNFSSDCEEFVDIMMPKKNRFQSQQGFQNQLIVQQAPVQLNQNNEQNNQEKDQKNKGDIDDLIRKSNIRYKTEKEIQEIQKQQKQVEMQKLKEKLKKQEEEIRKRNQQKTQQFKEKKKRKEKDQQQQKQEQLLQQQDKLKRRKSVSKQTSQSQSTHQTSRQNVSQQNTSRDIQKPEISKEQFDQATRNRVKELMKKQKEEKEKQDEEKEKKRLKLEILRQEQLIQLQKAKIKTIEQEEEERKAMQIKRPGGGGLILQNQQKRDSRQSLHQKASYEQIQNQPDESEEELEQADLQQESLNQSDLQQEQRERSLKQKKQQQKTTPSKTNKQKVNSNNQKTAKSNIQPMQDLVSESFLRENIRASIKQLYPECSIEELIQLEEEYKKEFFKQTQKSKQLSSQKQHKSRNSAINRPKSSNGQKKSNISNNINNLQKQKQQIVKQNQSELNKILELKKFEDFDVESVQNPIEMINQLKDLANQIQQDIDQNDQKYGVGKYKHSKQKKGQEIQNKDNNQQNQSEQMKEEIKKLEKEAYLKQLYLNAQNTFTPQEMQDFELYLQAHLVDGEIVLTSDEEDQSESEDDDDKNQSQNEEDDYDENNSQRQGDDDEDVDNDYSDKEQESQSDKSENEIQSDKKQQLKQQKQKQAYQQQGYEKITNNQKDKNKNSIKNQIGNMKHSKSVQENINTNASNKRGRSQDPKAPKSCLVKEQKQKRSKTVTFDQEFVKSEQKTYLQTSPSIKQQKEKYDFNEFDDFNDRDILGTASMAAQYIAENERDKENNSQNINNQQMINQRNILQQKNEEDQQKKFEKKINDVKEIIQQYSGDKKGSLDMLLPVSSLESSNSSNLRLSHLKTQNIPSQFQQNETPKTMNQYGLKVQQNLKNNANQIKIINQNNQKNNKNDQVQIVQQQNIVPSMKNSNKNIHPLDTNMINQPDQVQKKKIDDSKKQDQPSPIQITQSSPQVLSNIPTEFESEFLNFNEQFDIDQFKNQLSQDDLKQIIHVNNLDLKKFFTNEKLNSFQKAPNQGLTDTLNSVQYQNYYNMMEDEADEGLFDEESPKNGKKVQYEDVQSSQQAFNYYEKNKALLQSNEKHNNQKYNNFINTQDTSNIQNKKLNLIEYNSNQSDFNKELFDDDKLFALSATDLLKLAETNTKLNK
ncbi:hypothetical protein TTHERM_00295530 (macronuclear) [Tetrahymena thermophila SB210]|uniref:Uncharacterized protein n=1 Tax=Tetrahymena thermophila (strain SB210) TaxID=312017 RepID=I7MDY2_TETTS|nr:hypothetical protein TTHERM_00295530 [Tetrahymena thermophila SB210]EAR92940.4 hypothetical protein TTHERM_00295530 [Tetrahymena thermophila SB210]|eukprot:XP_001013185.4 hypothetical protein TTHERM_00295530 [Tetrahymena thermophila SB210]